MRVLRGACGGAGAMLRPVLGMHRLQRNNNVPSFTIDTSDVDPDDGEVLDQGGWAGLLLHRGPG